MVGALTIGAQRAGAALPGLAGANVDQLAFQLDGNIAAAGGAANTTDWDQFFTPAATGNGATVKATLPGPFTFTNPHGPTQFTGKFTTADFKADWQLNSDGTYNTADTSTYATGSKDTLGLNGTGSNAWQCKPSNNVGNKVDITNFYVTAFSEPVDSNSLDNHLVVYFGMEKFGSNGTNDIGVWFLGDPNADCSTPSATINFSGHHTDGDILLTSEFTSGGTTSSIEAFEWVCENAQGVSLTGLACDDQGFLKDGGKIGNVTVGIVNGAGCAGAADTDSRLCAVTNSSAITGVPWKTASSAGVGGTVPTVQFYEGGADLTAIAGKQVCVARAIGDTRSSATPNATLFDFASEPFSVCHPQTSLTKTSNATVVNGVATAHVNQNVTYTYTETNTGTDGLTNVSVSDNKCSPVTASATGGFNNGDTNKNGILDPGEAWVFTCTTSYPASGTYTNTATATGTDPLLGNATITWCSNPNSPPTGTICSQGEQAQATVKVINPGTILTKAASATTVHNGDSVTYTYTERNSGDAALTQVSVSDNKCAPVSPTLSAGFNVGDTNKNNVLDPGETWTYTCTQSLSVPAGATSPPTVTNTATGSGLDPLGNTVTFCTGGTPPNATTTCSQTEQATATVTVLHPSTSLTKSSNAPLAGGVPTVENGASVTYTYNETNNGDSALGNVSISDNLCSPVTPTVSGGFNVGDTNRNSKLDPGETWTFTCTTTLNVAAGTGTAPVVTNTATGHGTDALGFDVTFCAAGTSPASTICTPGEQAQASVTVQHPATSLKKSLSAVVTYTYTEQNTGDTPLTNAAVADNNCGSGTTSPVLAADHVHNVGDANANGVLDPGETWNFTCQTTITFNSGDAPKTVTNVATGSGTDPLGNNVTYCSGTAPAGTVCSQGERDTRTINIS